MAIGLRRLYKALPDSSRPWVRRLHKRIQALDGYEGWTHGSRRGQLVEQLLDDLDTAFGGCGVEAVFVEGSWAGDYYRDCAAKYVNTGDSYAETFIFDTQRGRFYLMSTADWQETAERTGRLLRAA